MNAPKPPLPKPPLVVIAGPTASGKSALAVALAERANGVVINADASQVYADLRILSARPSPADEARAPHRLYGVIDGDITFSAAAWADLARAAVAEAYSAGQLPILVGGSGLYLRTLLDGIAPVPPVADDIREAVRALAPADVYAELERFDPAAATLLNPADRQRVARALEVVRATGRSLADWQAEPAGGIGSDVSFHAYICDVDRDTLYGRCDSRFGSMLDQGALHEVEALVARRLPGDRPVMKALGVPPLARHLVGEMSLEAAVALARRDTRHYAKRQTTWFRNQTPDWRRVNPVETTKFVDDIAIKLRL